MEFTASELWSRIIESARGGCPTGSLGTYTTFLSSTRAAALSEAGLEVEAPSQFHVGWIEDKYRPLLAQAAERIVGRPIALTFRTGANYSPKIPSIEVSPPAQQDFSPHRPGPAAPLGRRPALNDRYTFDRFVVGDNNQLAAAACHAVAEKPAETYNPLFLYGGVGLGKTHLMHAIGNTILQDAPTKRVIYVSTEQFMNELVTSIQEGTAAEFRRRYRQMDLLLVDDVHFLEGKERTQEEFFHTFNALYENKKQIILTSDRPPKEIPGLEERLVSRFEWGLVADIMAPDYETRVAILRKKAADDHLTLDDAVIDFIAHACTASVRELEGAVIKLLAYSSLKHQEITVSLARTALSAMLSDDAMRGGSGAPGRLTPETVREVVARRWRVKPEGLVSKRRTKDLTVPRQVAMFLIREILETPLVQIGELFGGRDHSTVIHSIRKVEEQVEEDPGFGEQVDEARKELVEPKQSTDR